MPNVKVELAAKYMTAPQVSKLLSLSLYQFNLRITRGVLPPPTIIEDKTNTRYFDDRWVRIARALLTSSIKDTVESK